MARQMKTVHARKTESMTLVIETPKGRNRSAPPCQYHKDKRRSCRASQRVKDRKEQGD